MSPHTSQQMSQCPSLVVVAKRKDVADSSNRSGESQTTSEPRQYCEGTYSAVEVGLLMINFSLDAVAYVGAMTESASMLNMRVETSINPQ